VIDFTTAVVYIAIPYVLGALAAAITERSGIVDLAVEAKLMFGAFAAAAVAHATGSLALGVVGGGAAGALVGLAQAACAAGLRADHVIVGIGLNLVALGGTRYLLQVLYGEGANSPAFLGYGDALAINPVFWIAIVAAAVVPWVMARTRAGLRTRAAGDRPDALRAVGVSVLRTRLGAALLGGMLAGFGGAHLSLSVGVAHADMTGGRGFTALAAVILVSWRPGLAALACLAFSIAIAVNNLLQTHDAGVPRELAPMLPYLLTLVVLAIWGGGRRPPAALGSPDA
jgi:simple sugar transport system permease protein